MSTQTAIAYSSLLALAGLATSFADPASGTASSSQASPQSYFSPEVAINPRTVERLGLAWSYDLGTARGQEATPVVVDGVMYASGYIGIVYALDARTGKQKWRFDPAVDLVAMRDACCDAVNRGVAVWRGRVYVASIDGKLHALDANSGAELWSADTIVDHTLGYSSSGAPFVAHNVVVVGNSGGDMGRGGVRGYVSAYDLVTGALKWRFFTVPPAPHGKFEHAELALAARTWDPDRNSAYPGGAAVWDSMTYDPVLNLLYFGTGNAAPTDVRKLGPKSGDQLFSCSIIALNPDTGRLSWYFQTTPGDRWDFDATQNLVFASLELGGQRRRVIMQANKNGFFYVLDRESGKLLSGDKFTYVTWAAGIDPKSGRPIVTEQANYFTGPKNLYPSAAGGHSWQPMSFDPVSQLVYIPVIDMSNVWLDLSSSGGRIKYINGSFTVVPFFPDDTYDAAGLKSLFGSLPTLASIRSERKGPLVRELIRAWNPVTRKIAWEQETSSGRRGYDGGILSTAGNLVFQGRGSGEFVVYAADSGRVLKTIQTGSHIMAAPMSYEVDGIQYVAVQTGFGGAGMTIAPIPQSSAASKYSNENRLLAFRLDGGSVPVPAARDPEPFPPPPASNATPDQIQLGEIKFAEQCSRCHVFGPSVTPDLRKLPVPIHAAFNEIVLGGAFAAQGMEKFGDLLSTGEVEAIHAYLIDQQHQAYVAQPR